VIFNFDISTPENMKRIAEEELKREDEKQQAIDIGHVDKTVEQMVKQPETKTKRKRVKLCLEPVDVAWRDAALLKARLPEGYKVSDTAAISGSNAEEPVMLPNSPVLLVCIDSGSEGNKHDALVSYWPRDIDVGGRVLDALKESPDVLLPALLAVACNRLTDMTKEDYEQAAIDNEKPGLLTSDALEKRETWRTLWDYVRVDKTEQLGLLALVKPDEWFSALYINNKRRPGVVVADERELQPAITSYCSCMEMTTCILGR